MLERVVNYFSHYPNVLMELLMVEAKLSVIVTDASFSIIRGERLKFIYRLGILTVSIFLLFSLSYATNNCGDLFAEAQSSLTTVQDEQNANEVIQTFQIDGAVGSLVTDLLNPTIKENVTGSTPPLYVLAGNWSMGVVNGEVNYLQVDFIMALENGMQAQVYSIENLENIVIPSSAQNTGLTRDQELSSSNINNLVLSSTNNYSLSLFGYVDVLTGGTMEWQNVPVSINIFNGSTISILLYPAETDNRFKGQPIYGVVTWILDANNEPIKPSIWTDVT
jgi:hypothetical protein